jgi:hypothetical protein
MVIVLKRNEEGEVEKLTCVIDYKIPEGQVFMKV